MASIGHVHLKSLGGRKLKFVGHYHEGGARSHSHLSSDLFDYGRRQISLLRGYKQRAREAIEKRLVK